MAQIVEQWDLAFDDSAETKAGPERNYTQVFDVILDNVYRDAWYILTYSKCPKLGTHHWLDGAAFVVSIVTERVNDTAQWKVTVKWSTQIEDPANEPNPLNRPIVIDIDSTIESVPTYFDAKNNLLLNTAGDMVPGQRSLPFLSVTVKKNLPKYPDWMWDYNGTVNKNGVTIRKRKFPPRTLRVEGIGAPDKVFENGVWYYPFSYAMKSDPRTFDELRINQGFHELVKAGPDGNLPPSGQSPDGNRNPFGGGNASTSVVDDSAKKYDDQVQHDYYVKRRITVGSPPEYPTEPQFLDIKGRFIPVPRLQDVVVLRRRIEIEEDFSKLILK